MAKTPAKATTPAKKAPSAKKTAAAAVPSTKQETAGKTEKIGKAELVAIMVTKAQLSAKNSALVLDATLEIIVERLKAGDRIGLPGLGTLVVRDTQARTGVRPGTSEKIDIPAGKKLAFKMASDLKGHFKG